MLLSRQFVLNGGVLIFNQIFHPALSHLRSRGCLDQEAPSSSLCSSLRLLKSRTCRLKNEEPVDGNKGCSRRRQVLPRRGADGRDVLGWLRRPIRLLLCSSSRRRAGRPRAPKDLRFIKP